MSHNRIRSRWTRALAGMGVTVLLAGGLSSGPLTTPADASTSSATATIAGFPVWAHFDDPATHAGSDPTIVNELIRLVNAAPAGSTIQGTAHSLTLTDVADSLLAAQTRGVTVKMVIDGKNDPDNSTADDSAAITTIKKLKNRRFCYSGGGTGCITTDSSGIMHAKFFTFTSTKDPKGVQRSNVSWFGSANFTKATGLSRFNNAITVYGDTALMNGLNADFADMYALHHFAGNDYYDAATDRGQHLSTSADTYFSPEAEGQTDTIVNRVNDLTPNADCRLRIAQAFVNATRPKIVSMVKDFTDHGCKVWMVVGSEDNGDIAMTKSVYTDLIASGVSIRRRPDIHDKTFLAYGKYGSSNAYRVYTGSQNWSGSALSSNDELFVKMGSETGTSHPLYDAYYAHFNDAYNIGTTCTKSNYPCRG